VSSGVVESHMNDFKPHGLGVIDLKFGRAELSLRAQSISGKDVMDVEAISLTLLK
jgi:hypothetical protein